MERENNIQHGKREGGFIRKFTSTLNWFEIMLAMLSVVLVIMGVIHLVSEMINYSDHLHGDHMYLPFQEALSYILFLVVGIELAIMLVKRTPESLINVMFFVVARKMLIKTDHVYELVIGVVALAGLFAIRKYLEK